jgi:hypothetical protein
VTDGEVGDLGLVELRRERLDRVVGGDLQRLGRALVLRVLEQPLRGARPAAEQVERALGERERLADDGLGEAQRVVDEARVLRRGVLVERFGVGSRLAQVALEQPAVRTARRHREVRGEGRDQRALGRERLVEVAVQAGVVLGGHLQGLPG